MSAGDHLAGPGFRRLFTQVRVRLEREPGAPDSARTVLRGPSDAERAAVGGLLGRTFQGATVAVTLGELDQALVTATTRGLRSWLETISGPLRDRPAEARTRESRIAQAVESAQQSPLATEPWFGRWLASLGEGALTRMVSEQRLSRLAKAVDVLEALPAEDVPIALFASRSAGGTKALDGTPLERLVLGALATQAGVERPTDAGARRALWERSGVVPDDLASHVLVLNLPATGDGVVDQMLRSAAEHGLPLRLTLHQLVRHPPTLAPAPLYVCENPAVLRMAAERLGPQCAPLVSTEGRPGTAFWRLMGRHSGPCRVRADFDKDGLEIAGAVLARTRGVSWRFDAATYSAAPKTGVGLPKRLPETPWDAALGQVMAGGRRVEEEQVLELLLGDLAEEVGQGRDG
jgi:uncharacterized protein (TIGR02679 family)